MALRNYIVHNFWLKLFSVALATMIWVTIHFGIQNDFALSQPGMNRLVSREYLKVPVTVATQSGDGRVYKITPEEVIVVAVGEDAVLRKAQSHIKVYVDLTDFHSQGATNMELQADVPHNINVIEIKPASVRVEQISP
jgi:hypothetical protein